MDFSEIESLLKSYLLEHDFLSSGVYIPVYYENIYGYFIFEAIYHFMGCPPIKRMSLEKEPYLSDFDIVYYYFYNIKISFSYYNKMGEEKNGVIKILCNGQPYWNINPTTPISAEIWDKEK